MSPLVVQDVCWTIPVVEACVAFFTILTSSNSVLLCVLFMGEFDISHEEPAWPLSVQTAVGSSMVTCLLRKLGKCYSAATNPLHLGRGSVRVRGHSWLAPGSSSAKNVRLPHGSTGRSCRFCGLCCIIVRSRHNKVERSSRWCTRSLKVSSGDLYQFSS
ncbi:hypothetical protein V5799_027410 [Amblyomma americanum]|uniref:Uncharacterized protein n=1 Tax=Amblyomma americanum TaxID=6943 RepID=A0AAQ4DFT4_AMBAM